MSGQARYCRACGALIFFRKTEAGKWTPEDQDGTPHWQTCSNPERFSRPHESSKDLQARVDSQQNLFEGGEMK